ncbi:UDP-N-acetylglucosamine 1-carboxyvinyltransferase [bacterium]|nr:UDP-N-acetylglucosamine 1-carboxyvinyltransferase [bacterium]
MTRYIIEGGRPLSGTVRPSGNKNEALPALMACLLTEEPITFRRLPRIKDVLTVCDILEDMGVTVNWESEEVLTLQAKELKHHKPNEEKCAHVRAAILLLGPLLARVGKIELAPPGGDVIGARRMDTHFDGAKALGATLKFEGNILGEAKKIVGAEILMDEPSVTATENLLLMAAMCEGETVLFNAASEPHVVGICNLLNAMGAKITGVGSNRLTIEGVPKLGGADHTIGPDFMEVGSFLCLGAIGGGKLRIEGVNVADLRFALKTWKRVGIDPVIGEDYLEIDGTKELEMLPDISGRIGTVYSGPWPAFPTDLMSVTIVAATQAKGTMIFFEKMFEGRMFFTDKLMSMGANIVLCDPHRVVITGPEKLYSAHMSSPDVRAGMSMVMAACIAKGTSIIDNVYQVERGYHNIAEKLNSIGASIKRVTS